MWVEYCTHFLESGVVLPSWTTLNRQPSKQPSACTSADGLILITSAFTHHCESKKNAIMLIKKHWNLTLSEFTLSYPSSTQLMVVYQLIKWSFRHVIRSVEQLFFFSSSRSIDQTGRSVAGTSQAKWQNQVVMLGWREKTGRMRTEMDAREVGPTVAAGGQMPNWQHEALSRLDAASFSACTRGFKGVHRYRVWLNQATQCFEYWLIDCLIEYWLGAYFNKVIQLINWYTCFQIIQNVTCFDGV